MKKDFHAWVSFLIIAFIIALWVLLLMVLAGCWKKEPPPEPDTVLVLSQGLFGHGEMGGLRHDFALVHPNWTIVVKAWWTSWEGIRKGQVNYAIGHSLGGGDIYGETRIFDRVILVDPVVFSWKRGPFPVPDNFRKIYQYNRDMDREGHPPVFFLLGVSPVTITGTTHADIPLSIMLRTIALKDLE